MQNIRKLCLKIYLYLFLRKERIKTTLTKAKIFRPFIEKIITRAKVDNLHNRRIVYEKIRNTNLLKKLFINVAKRYLHRNGGYTRIYKLGKRKGDGADICIIELVPELISDDSNDDDKGGSDSNQKKIEDKKISLSSKNKQV